MPQSPADFGGFWRTPTCLSPRGTQTDFDSRKSEWRAAASALVCVCVFWSVRLSPCGVRQSPRRTHFESFRKMDSARTLQESARSPAESEADFKVRESPRRTFLKSAADLSPAESARVRSDSGGLWRTLADSGGVRSDSGGLKILMILCPDGRCITIRIILLSVSRDQLV